MDVGWLDDCVPRACAHSEAERLRAHSAIHGTWLKRVSRRGMAIISNNGGWHADDSIHRMMQSPAFCVFWAAYEGIDRLTYRIIRPPAGWSGATEGVWPHWPIWTREVLAAARDEDPVTYTRMFEQRTRSEAEMRLPAPERWITYRPEDLPGPATGARAVAYLDPAGGKRVDKGDFAAIVLSVIGHDRAIYVVDVWVQRKPPADQIAALWRTHRMMLAAGWPGGLTAARMETMTKDEGWLSMAVQTFRSAMRESDPEASWMPLGYDYADGAAPKASRIERLHGPLGTGQLRFPAGFLALRREDSDRGRSWDRLLSQCEDFGQAMTGSHDDGPDALEGCWRLALATGPGLSDPSSGIAGPREHARDLRALKQEFTAPYGRRDPRTGERVKPTRRRGLV
jgi:hypothetical protein